MLKNHVIIHTVVLVFAVFLAYLLSRTLGQTYDLELTALLFVGYVFVRRLTPKRDFGSGVSTIHIVDAAIFTLILLHLVLTSGGLASPLFFLVYFLLFSVALILEPIVSLTTAIAIIFIFLSEVALDNLTTALPLFSLPFIVPFALIIGREYRNIHKHRQQIAALQAKERSVETDALMFVSTVVRGHIKTIAELAHNFHGDHELSRIQATARRLQKLIDKFESQY